jgi:hypothetical protein
LADEQNSEAKRKVNVVEAYKQSQATVKKLKTKIAELEATQDTQEADRLIEATRL